MTGSLQIYMIYIIRQLIPTSDQPTVILFLIVCSNTGTLHGVSDQLTLTASVQPYLHYIMMGSCAEPVELATFSC